MLVVEGIKIELRLIGKLISVSTSIRRCKINTKEVGISLLRGFICNQLEGIN